MPWTERYGDAALLGFDGLILLALVTLIALLVVVVVLFFG